MEKIIKEIILIKFPTAEGQRIPILKGIMRVWQNQLQSTHTKAHHHEILKRDIEKDPTSR